MKRLTSVWTVAVSTCAVALLMLAPKAMAQGGSCRDPWINSAYNQLYHRAPQGAGNSGECNIELYGHGHWSSFGDLENKIRAAKAVSAPAQSCRDAWITNAYQQMYHRAPQGSGNSGECNPALYGGGHWSNFGDLEAKIRQSKGGTPFYRPYQPNPPSWPSVCQDPWITQAYHQMYARLPQGRGTSGECNPALYGGGHWSNFADLENKIRASKNDSGTRAPSPETLLVGRFGDLYNYWGEVVQKTDTFLIEDASNTNVRQVGTRRPNAGEVIHLPAGENGRNFRRGNGYGKVIIVNVQGRGRR